MRRGEIWRVRLPFAPGHRQAGERPAVVVQEDSFLATLPTVLLIPFTGNQTATRFAGTLLVQPDSQNGLTSPSVALVFQLSALDKRDCLRRVGVLDMSTLQQVMTMLDKLTGR
jgi:mRNA interferase MazF